MAPQAVETINWVAAFQLGILLLTRVVPIVVLTPVFGGQMVPPRFRFAVSLVFAGCLAAAMHDALRPVVPLVSLALLMLKELAVGLLMAMAVLIVFQVFAAAGAVVDLLRGDQALSTFDPHMQRNESRSSVFFTQLAVVLFLTLGGHRHLFAALADTIVMIPPHGAMPARMTGPAGALAVVGLVGQLFVVALQLAGPVLVVVLVLDVCMALAGRMARPIDVAGLGFALKGWVAVGVLALSFGGMIGAFEDQLASFMRWMSQMLGLAI